MKALELPVHSDHHDGFVYSSGYRPVLAWYVSLKSLIHATASFADTTHLPSRSSIPGSVIPSPLQFPPFFRKYLACEVLGQQAYPAKAP